MAMPGIVTLDTGEDVYLADLMVGIDTLPRRQREAFELVCLQGYTEAAAKAKMLPHSRSSTPIQQYSDSGLARMVARYDEKQIGGFFPALRRLLMTTPLHPVFRHHVENARKDIMAQIEGLKVALSQVDEVLKPSATPRQPPKVKPTLEEAAAEEVSQELMGAT